MGRTKRPSRALRNGAQAEHHERAAFEDYYRLGTNRTLRGLAEHYQRRAALQAREGTPGAAGAGQDGGGDTVAPPIHLRTLEGWSARYDWQARIAERDQEMLEAARQARLKAAADQERRRMQGRTQLESQFAELGQAGFRVAYQALLNKLLQTQGDVPLGNGRTLPADPDAMGAQTMLAFMGQCAELWARGLGVGARIARWQETPGGTVGEDEAAGRRRKGLDLDGFRKLFDETFPPERVGDGGGVGTGEVDDPASVRGHAPGDGGGQPVHRGESDRPPIHLSGPAR